MESHFISSLNELLIGVLSGLSVVYLFSGFDDLFLDVVALVARLRPKELTKSEIQKMESDPQKRIAIIVPAWKEGNIIDRMLAGNLSRIEYKNFDFFVGVYPNDPLTVEKVKEVEAQSPHVHAVVNHEHGPTSKGQILNRVIGEIFEYEKLKNVYYDAFLMQDAEDLIHPRALSLVNLRLADFDFIQIPVFSLEVRGREWVAGTYVDEFAESHTKDILVRNYLGAAVPSAGVGTALSRPLVDKLFSKGGLFNEKTVTEDYQLGIQAHLAGFRAHFAAAYYPVNGKKEFIATREYFPKKFSRSVRQKTRWTVGIALQGWRQMGWRGNLSNRYFLARDRKGMVTNLAAFLGYPCLILTTLLSLIWKVSPIHSMARSHFWSTLLILNVVLMVNRFLQRTYCVTRIYGVGASIPVILRWPVGSVINALASFEALKSDSLARMRKVSVAWVKTEHELPTYFGAPAPSPSFASK